MLPIQYYKSFYILNGLGLNRCAHSASFQALQPYPALLLPIIRSLIPLFKGPSQQEPKQTQVDLSIYTLPGAWTSSLPSCTMFFSYSTQTTAAAAASTTTPSYSFSFIASHAGFCSSFSEPACKCGQPSPSSPHPLQLGWCPTWALLPQGAPATNTPVPS